MNQYIFKQTAKRNAILAFFVGIVFGCLFTRFWTEDSRIEQADQEQAQAVQFSKIVQAHYQKECRK